MYENWAECASCVVPSSPAQKGTCACPGPRRWREWRPCRAEAGWTRGKSRSGGRWRHRDDAAALRAAASPPPAAPQPGHGTGGMGNGGMWNGGMWNVEWGNVEYRNEKCGMEE